MSESDYDATNCGLSSSATLQLMNKKSCLAYIVDPPSPRPLPLTIRFPMPISVFVCANAPLLNHVDTPVYFCKDCADAPSPKLHHVVILAPSPTCALSPHFPQLLIVVGTLITLVIFSHPLKFPHPLPAGTASMWNPATYLSPDDVEEFIDFRPQKSDFDQRYITVVVESVPESPIAELQPELPSNILHDLDELIGQPANIMIPKLLTWLRWSGMKHQLILPLII
ncbi:hypothetical protein DSO57_1003645 [Entomophthora muscae]|uniref:Uncharacterized protein n=1 Tax=Entomophthora muscae TaxID=34485 RepID=A0ACC2SL92_9FUNG|nr:hypothetical protein DSO57_1003645 [Entomophthora muscae]